MNFEKLKNPELQEKLKSAKTPEDILALAKAEGYELSDEQLPPLPEYIALLPSQS